MAAYQRVARGLRNPRRIRDALLRTSFLTLCLVLVYPVLFVYVNLRLHLVLLSYLLIFLTTVVLYLLACYPLPPCAGKVARGREDCPRHESGGCPSRSRLRLLHFDSVLIVSFGGPQGLADIRPFLANVLRGRRVSPERVEEVAHHYELFGGVSPITEITRRRRRAAGAARGAGHPLPVYVGMRNWHRCSRHAARDARRGRAACDRVHRRGAALVFQLPAVPRERRRRAAELRRDGARRRRHLRRQLVRSSAVRRGQRGARARGARTTARVAARRGAAGLHRAQHSDADGRAVAVSRAAATSARLVATRRGHARLGARVSEPQRAARGSVARAGRLRLPAPGAQEGCGRRCSVRSGSSAITSRCSTTSIAKPPRYAARSGCRWRARRRSTTIRCSST